jgi:lipopolysaccharide heptosyltransferase II
LLLKSWDSMEHSKYKIEKILVIRMSSIGDIILTTPLLRATKKEFPEAGIDFLTKKQFQQLMEHNPNIRRAIGLDTGKGFLGLLRLIKELRQEHYDLVVDLHVSMRSILVRYLCGARMQRRAQKYSLQRRLLKWFRINLLKNKPPVAERYFTALEDFKVRPDGLGPEVYVSRLDQARAKKYLDHAGLSDRILIGLAPGASKFTKRWPVENFVAAGVRLARDLDAGVLVLGGEDDQKLCEELSSLLKAAGVGSVLNLAGELSILQSTAAISRVKVLVSNDTALMHLATASDTPVVAIFGPTAKAMGFFPYSKKAVVVEKEQLNCRPCSLHGDNACPKKHFKCMKEVAPEQVIAAAEKLLSELEQSQHGSAL